MALESRRLKKSMYFKFDHQVLALDRAFREAERIWKTHPKEGLEPRVKWILAWKRLRLFFKKQQGEKRKRIRELEEMEEELQLLRIQSERVDKSRLAQLEREVRKKENLEAATWRRRSRNRWFKEGEAPSKYFFSQLKSKHQRESITALKLDDGEVVSEDGLILKEIESFYANLYRKDAQVEANHSAWEQVLSHVTKEVSTQQNMELDSRPTMEELENLVKWLPEEKARGSTVEILTRCWSFMKQDCLDMLTSYWVDGVMPTCDLRGVIKLLHKNEERQRLRNWRHIILLTLTYKLISKMLACRLKVILLDLVDEHQTGFIDGRSIHDSILLHRLSQEFAATTKQDVVLLKLDFEKAYDRVSHAYLVAVLRKMNFSPLFIKLTQGLLSSGTAKVHTNGLFTGEFELGRGVRQGCPIAPLLFALCTEPLMAMLRSHQQDGSLVGVRIPGGRQALYNLFVDDIMAMLSIQATDSNYRKTCEVLHLYEEAFGARLNVRKFGDGTGVYEGDTVVDEPFRMIIMAQKILPSLPAYILMTFGLSAKGYKSLEGRWRTFIWGVRDDGRPKKSSIAWDIMQGRKSQRGIQVMSLADHSAAVKIRQISKILVGDQTAWTKIARALITRSLNSGRQRNERSRWTPEEALLIGPKLTLKDSATLGQLLKPWYKIREKLRFIPEGAQLPRALTTSQCLAIATGKSGVFFANEISLKKFLKREHFNSFQDLQHLTSQMCDAAARTSGVVLGYDREKLRRWHQRIQPVSDVPLQTCGGWTWPGVSGKPSRSGWMQETKWWKLQLLIDTPLYPKLNRKWGVQLNDEEWNRVWTTTWQKPSTTREGFWWWRTLWQGFWCGDRARKAQVSDGVCPRCLTEVETPEHLFWSCSKSHDRWDELRAALHTLGVNFRLELTWFGFKRQAISLKNSNAMLWAVAAELYKTFWRERTERVFRNTRVRVPLQVVIHEAGRSVSAWLTERMSDKQRTITITMLETLTQVQTNLEARAALHRRLGTAATNSPENDHILWSAMT
ncbi:hypothetical protein R1sor_015023 [Riccia sorocarpa]|uniref:Reverse transcriptase domain-containing protein n=1 Tax=Riccia sorocarpa TaxID=122646 RepID=A0ABD3HH90_9MARC